MTFSSQGYNGLQGYIPIRVTRGGLLGGVIRGYQGLLGVIRGHQELLWVIRGTWEQVRKCVFTHKVEKRKIKSGNFKTFPKGQCSPVAPGIWKKYQGRIESRCACNCKRRFDDILGGEVFWRFYCFKKNKSPEQRLNLSRSWHKDHSRTYNTSFLFKSYTKDLSFPIFQIVFQHRLNLV